MSAIPEEFLQRTAELSSESTKPLDGSKKIYVTGSRDDIRVPMREIQQDDTAASFGPEKNPPIPVYDTSGPYTDPEVCQIRIRLALLTILRTGPIQPFSVVALVDPATSDVGKPF